jgi:hypothetical protein
MSATENQLRAVSSIRPRCPKRGLSDTAAGRGMWMQMQMPMPV